MSDAVKKQQGSARKPGRPKGSTTKKNTGTTTAKRQSSTSRDKSRPRRPAYEEEEDESTDAEAILEELIPEDVFTDREAGQ